MIPKDVAAVAGSASQVELEVARARKLLNDAERLRAKCLVC